MNSNDIKIKFTNTLKKMATPSERLLLGVSGGVDSMTLLSLMSESGCDFAVAHCNYHLRGEDSNDDEKLVRERCEELGVKCYVAEFTTKEDLEQNGDSLQNYARKLRYGWFDEICRKDKFDKVVIAHNSGDSVETFFINLLRGTGIRGLIGIPTTRDNIIRPLMSCTREDIVQYAVKNGVKWRDDISNSGTKYLRNKIRHLITPEFKKIEPNFEDVMLDNFQRIGESSAFISSMIQHIRNKALSSYRGQLTLSLGVIEQFTPFEYVLFEILSPMGFTRSDCADMIDCYRKNDGSKRFSTSSYNAILTRGLLLMSEITDEIADLSCKAVIEDIDTPCSVMDTTLEFDTLEAASIAKLPSSPQIAMIDAQKVKLPLMVRTWVEGDTFVPLGMHGRKKLSDFFIDAKVSIADKERQLLLCNADGDIIWVIGRRLDNRFKVTDKTETILRINSF